MEGLRIGLDLCDDYCQVSLFDPETMDAEPFAFDEEGTQTLMPTVLCRDREEEVWYIGEDGYRGKGIAKKIQLNLYDYVFYKMGFNRLYSDILSFNTHEITNVHEAVGYQVEGVLKQHVIKNGEYLDVVMMGITKDHWEEIKDNFDYPVIEFED